MQSHHHHAGGADHAEVGGRRRRVFGGHEGKDEGRWALFCDLVGDVDDDIYIMMSVCLFVCNEKSSLPFGFHGFSR